MEYVTLSNGNKMPIVGLGTWLAENDEELTAALDAALELGYRHIDTAWIYKNEAVIGKTLKKWIDSGKLKREELFIVTKLPFFGINTGRAEEFLNQSLKNLQLDYVDLYLIHVPFGVEYGGAANPIVIKDGAVVFDTSPESKLEEVWKVMEKFVAAGKVKSIGISNFEESQIERIVKVAKIQPSNLQVELHAYFQQTSLRALCSKYGISVTSYSSLGSQSQNRKDIKFEPLNLMDNPIVIHIAEKLAKTPAQILLRFLVQQGIIVIPKSTNPLRLESNFKILDFKLSPMDMTNLESLGKGDVGRTLKFDFLPGITKHPEFPESIRRCHSL
jgi:aldehyde reductase